MATPAAAAAPDNDDFENPRALVSGVASLGSTVEATAQEGEPAHSPYPATGQSVWFKWTANATGTVHVDSCASDFDAVVAVYGAAPMSGLWMNRRAYGDGGCGSDSPGAGAYLVFRAEAGKEYRLALQGWNHADKGDYSIVVNPQGERPAPPVNDTPEGALTLSGASADATGTNVDATDGWHDEWSALGTGSVYWKWTSPVDGQVRIDTCASGFAAGLVVMQQHPDYGWYGVWAGQGCDPYTKAVFNAVKDKEYRIGIAGQRGESGPIAFSLRAQTDTTAPVARFTKAPPAVSGIRYFRGWEHMVDEHPHSVECSFDGGAWSQCETSLWNLSEGEHSYRIRARDQYGNLQDPPYEHRWRIEQPPAPNDAFADAIRLRTDERVTVNNGHATAEPGEPRHHPYYGPEAGASRSVWFTFTAASDLMELDLCGSKEWMLWSIYTGDRVDALTEAASGYLDDDCRIEMYVTPGTTYHLAVDGDHGSADLSTGPITVLPTGTAFGAPPNDDFAGARSLVAGVASTGATFTATAEPGEPAHSGGPAGKSVWFKWTAPSTGTVQVDACESGFHAALAVYAATTLEEAWPARTAYGDWGCLRDGRQGSFVTFRAQAGQEYRIALQGSLDPSEGAYKVVLNTLGDEPPPANDTPQGAIAISGAGVDVTATNVGATDSWRDPQTFSTGSVFWKWTSPVDGETVIDTCASAFAAQVAVFERLPDGAWSYVRAGDGCDNGREDPMSFFAVKGKEYLIGIGGLSGGHGAIKFALRAGDDTTAPVAFISTAPPAVSGDRFASFEWGVEEQGLMTFECSLDAGPWGACRHELVELDLGEHVFSVRATDQYGNVQDPPTEHRWRIEQPAPPNDAFAAAIPLYRDQQVTVNNALATAEPGERGHAPVSTTAARRSVWFEFVASGDVVRLAMCHVRFPAVWTVYTGTALDALSRFKGGVVGDNCYPELATVPGTRYRLAIDGNGEDVRYFGGTVTVAAHEGVSMEPPANDDFAAARQLESGTASTGSTRWATPQPGEPQAARSVWFRWTAAQSGLVHVDGCATKFDGVIAVYEGTSIAGAQPAYGDGGCDDLARAPYAVFRAEAGKEYRIMLSGRGVDDAGDYGLVVKPAAAAPEAPVNDAPANAIPVTGQSVELKGTNAGATDEWLQPSPVGTGSVYWKWTAPADGAVKVDTCGSAFQARVTMWDPAAAGDAPGVYPGCEATAPAQALAARRGREYLIAVSGTRGEAGAISLKLSVTPPAEPGKPAEDEPPAAQPPATPPPPPAVTPTPGPAVSFAMPRSMRARAARTLRLPGRVVCGAERACRVTVQVRGGRRVLHRQTVPVAAGRHAVVTLRLKPAALRALRRARRPQAVLVASSGTERVTHRLAMTLR